MLCPFCSTPLNVVNREGVEIDWCPGCKGVWLERGELDKIIERANGSVTREAPREAPRVPEYVRDDDRELARGPVRGRERDRDDDDDDWDDRPDRDDRHSHDDRRGPGGKRKRRGFLSEIFDFD